MKIVCESCGAKYSIADEKVAGKVFKIRCKKCSAVIVVKGDSPEGDESTRVYDYGGEAIWHVVVAGEQQGPFAPRQIGELLADGKIDWEAYVWREGMDGWQPAKDVEPLVSSVMSDSEGAKAPKAAAYGTGQVFGGSSDMGADPFAAADDGGLGSVIAQQAKSSAGVGDDLFAKSARSPFSGAAEEEERASVAAASSGRIANARVGGEALTGQRNENSVLFSLSNLQALATGGGGAAAAVNARPGMATGEGSGLIDIRALASATQAVDHKPNGSAREKVEDLLAVGSGSAGFSAANFAAPVAVEKADTNKLLVGGMIAAFVAILGLGGAVAYLVMREPPAAQPGAIAAVAEPGAAAAPGAQAAATPTGTAERPAAEPEPSAARGSDDGHEAREPRSPSAGGPSHAGGAKKPRESGGKPEKEPPAAAQAPAAAPTPAPAPKKSSGDQSIDDLLSGALGKPGGAPKPAAAKPAAADLPSSPSRDDVIGALNAVKPKVSACGNGQSGIATAKIAVAGSTGRVTGVDVSGQFAGTPVAACVSREVGKAKFPKFSQPSFSVTFPFKI
jgi:predicted Zn finger-like uncharacterized protein